MIPITPNNLKEGYLYKVETSVDTNISLCLGNDLDPFAEETIMKQLMTLSENIALKNSSSATGLIWVVTANNSHRFEELGHIDNFPEYKL